MNPELIPPPEFAAATPPAWSIASAVLFAVLLATLLTVTSLLGLTS